MAPNGWGLVFQVMFRQDLLKLKSSSSALFFRVQVGLVCSLCLFWFSLGLRKVSPTRSQGNVSSVLMVTE